MGRKEIEDKSKVYVDEKKAAKAAKKAKHQSRLADIKDNYYVFGVAYAMLGVGMLIIPDKINDSLHYLLGGILLFYSIVTLIRFFVGNDEKLDLFKVDFIAGACLAIAGLLVTFFPFFIHGMMPLVFGILLIFGAIVNFSDAMDLRKYEYKKWGWFAIASAISLIAGITFVCFSKIGNNSLMTRIIGAVYMLLGLNSAVGNLAAKVRKEKSEE